MTQSIFADIDPQLKSGDQLADDLNNLKHSLLTNHKGTSRPSYVEAGTLWVDDSSGTLWSIKWYTGTTDIEIGKLDSVNNIFIPSTGIFTKASENIKTDNYTLNVDDKGKLMIMNSATGKSFTFPDILGGEVYLIKNIGAGVLTLTPDASDSIEVASLNQNEGLILVADGTNNRWRVLSRYTSATIADEKVKISSADTNAGFLEGKLLAGEGLNLVKGNPGANENLTIAGKLATTTIKGVASFAATFFNVVSGVVNGPTNDAVKHDHIDWGYGANQVIETTILQQKIYQTQTPQTWSSVTTIPNDNTIPTSSEGAQVMSFAFTPKKSTSTLIIEVEAQIGTNVNEEACKVMCLFKDSETSARAVRHFYPRYGLALPWNLRYTMTSGTTSAITFKVRVGAASSTTIYLNRLGNGTDRFGGRMTSTIKITEIDT